MAGGSVITDSWRKIAIGAAIVIIFLFVSNGVPLKNAHDDQNKSQQTDSRLLPVDDVEEDPFAIQWLETKLKNLDLQPSSFKVSCSILFQTSLYLLLWFNVCFTASAQPQPPFFPINIFPIFSFPQCSDADNVHKTCMFENLIMYRGDLWFISDPKSSTSSSSSTGGTKQNSIILPEPLVFEVGNSPSNNFAIPEIISILTKSDALSKIEATAPTTGQLRLGQFDISIFQRTRTFNNWFWALNGAGNMFHRLCKYFDACTATDIKQAAVLQPIIESSRNLSEVGYVGLPHHHAQTVKDLMKCFGPLLWCVV